MTEQNVSDIFQSCIQAIQDGTATVEDCIARYPQVDDLEQLLRTVQTVQQLPEGTLSTSFKKSLERRLTNRMDYLPPAQTRRFSITFAVATSAIMALIVTFIFITLKSISTPQPASYSTPIPVTSPSATILGDFAVSITISGVIKSVTSHDSGNLTVILEDSISVEVRLGLITASSLVPGRSVTVDVVIDENNLLIAQKISISDPLTPVSSITPAVQGIQASTQSPICDLAANPVANKLAASFAVPVDEIMGWFCKGHGFGEITKAYLLAQKSGKLTVEQIFELRAAGKGWGDIAKEVGVKPGELVHPLK
jgi:hypothetical protein